MAKIQGTNVKCGYTPNGGTFTSFAYAKKATISMATDMQEVSSRDTGKFKDYMPMRISWTMACGCLLSDDESTVFSLFKDRTKIAVSWKTGTKAFSGNAYIKSLKATGNLHDMATFDIELQGTGELNYE